MVKRLVVERITRAAIPVRIRHEFFSSQRGRQIRRLSAGNRAAIRASAVFSMRKFGTHALGRHLGNAAEPLLVVGKLYDVIMRAIGGGKNSNDVLLPRTRLVDDRLASGVELVLAIAGISGFDDLRHARLQFLMLRMLALGQ